MKSFNDEKLFSKETEIPFEVKGEKFTLLTDAMTVLKFSDLLLHRAKQENKDESNEKYTREVLTIALKDEETKRLLALKPKNAALNKILV